MESYLDLKVGYDCNNNCIHCVIADQRNRACRIRGNENRSTDECKAEIHDSKKKGINFVVITGGEPTIRTDLIQILDYAQSLGMSMALQTNGRKFSQKSYTEKIAKYCTFIIVALHGSASDIHDTVTRVQGSFSQTVAGIRAVGETKSGLCVKTVISNRNKTDLVNIVKFIAALGIKRHNIAFPHANGNAAADFDGVVPYYKDIREELEKCIECANINKVRLDFEAVLPCAFRNRLDEKYFADIRSGYQQQSIELKQLDSGTLNWSQQRKAMKRKDKKCGDCLYDKVCEGYWMEYVQARGFSEFEAVV